MTLQYHQQSDNGRHDHKETMIRVPASVRSLVRIVTMCSRRRQCCLASCATPAIVTPHVTGLPAVSISVPLSTVACTTDNSCVAIGTSNLDVSPTSVGEYRTADRSLDVTHRAERRHVDLHTDLVVLERRMSVRRFAVEW